MEDLKYIYGQVNDWIKAADQKALILGSFNIAGFIYQLVSIESIRCKSSSIQGIFVLSVLASVAAFYFWVSIVYPRLDNKHKKSRVYFQHIANRFSDDIDAGIKEYESLGSSVLKRDLASQIIVNSGIAKKKYTYIQKFIWAFSIQLILMLTLIIAMEL